MIETNTTITNMLSNPVRRLKARVELLEGSTLLNIFTYEDALKEVTVERVGEASKFFGFGICQKLNVKLLDPTRQINITTANRLEVAFGADAYYMYATPYFKVTEVHRDETTNELSITAYDALYEASTRTVAELGLTSYSIRELAEACASLLGLPLTVQDGLSVFDTDYPSGANFEGTESIREVLNAIAEATQTIYYVSSEWELTFKRLGTEVALNIGKADYYSLTSGANKRLATIVHATELGDNVSASTAETGSTQYVRNNPFWELREDIGTLVENAVAAVGGLTINQFDCNWRGNFLLEIGDKIALTTKDLTTVTAYVLNDTILYNGALSQKTQWSYTDNDSETEANPSTLGEVLKQTYARVDKANKNIELLASEVDAAGEAVSQLQLSTNSISASVTEVKKNATEALETLNSDVGDLTKKVEATMTAEDVTLAIKTEMANGVTKVETTTGFTFNEEGLTVSKTGSQMTTTITEDGMTVYRDSEAVLTANNEGVDAKNLHATTYLIIGDNSRFEDFERDGEQRTACFWIGG